MTKGKVRAAPDLSKSYSIELLNTLVRNVWMEEKSVVGSEIEQKEVIAIATAITRINLIPGRFLS